MTDDSINLSRREILGGLGAVGASGVVGAAATTAFFSDWEELNDNELTAGELDLLVDWTEHYNGEPVGDQGFTNDPGPVFELDDVKPGDYGSATIGLRVFDNPAWIHVGGDLTANDDKGLTESEQSVDDTDGQGAGELAEAIIARVWYDGTDADDDGGNNQFEDGEVQITAGPLAGVLHDLSHGVLVDDQTTGGGTVPEECTEGPKLDRPPNTADVNEPINVGPGTVRITNIHYKDGDGGREAIGFDWSSENVQLCKIVVKGGRPTRTITYDCATSGTAFAPFNPRSGNFNGISHVTFHYCNGDDREQSCFPDSTTQYVGFEWVLPRDVGDEIQSDVVAFDLQFYAQQCRHNDEPDNPFV